MKKLVCLLALVLAIAMLAGCSLVSVNPEKVIVAKVGDKTITKAEFDTAFAEFLAGYGYTVDSEELADQIGEIKQNYIDLMVQDLVQTQKLVELGLDQISDEEKAAAEAEVDAWYQESIASLAENYSSEEDPEAAAKEYIDSYLTSYGTTLEQMKSDEVNSIPLNKLFDQVTADVTVSEDDVKAKYDEQVETDKELYSADLATFISARSYGTTIYYNPEGCFFVKHILIALPEEQQDEIYALRSDDDVTVVATADAKRDEYLAAIAEKAQMVLDKVTAGGDFELLLEEFGEDPGMKSDTYADGYLTYVGNTNYMTEFTEACDKLTADGMTSGLVATDYGYHIIRRVSTLASGAVAYDEVKAELEASLLDTAKEDAYTAQVQAWQDEMGVEIFADKL